MDEHARFCAACGAGLADATTTHAPARAATPVGVGATGHDVDGGPGEGDQLFSPPARRSDLVDCPACGVANSDARMLCAGCGADLDTGEQVAQLDDEVVRPGPASDVVAQVDVDDRRGRPRTLVVIAAIVVVGALVGVVLGILAVRAGGRDDGALPRFDPSAVQGDPIDLTVRGVGASSTLPAAGESRFVAGNMVDGDLATAWSHDPDAQLATEVDLAFRLDSRAWVTDVVLANGAQQDARTFAADGRIGSLLVVVEGTSVAELVLRDAQGYQRVTLPEPVLAETVRFVVEDVVEGDTFAEVSLSEVAFLGHPVDGGGEAADEGGAGPD